MRIAFFSLIYDVGLCLLHGGLHFCFGVILALELLPCLLFCLFDSTCHILHIFQEGYGESLARELFLTVHRPVAVLEVIMLDAAEFLDAAVSAVVVGHQKTFRGYDLSGAAASELDDCVFERRAVYLVNLLWGELAACFMQSLAVHFLDKGQKPHSFVGPDVA